MSLATWHPPPVTHIGFPNSTSNSEYGKWSPMPSNGHYAPVSLATSTPSSPWPNQKSRNSTSSYDSSDWNNSYNRKSDVINGGNGVSLPENTSSYPFANEVRKNGMLEQLNGENRKSRQIDANNNNSNISNDGRTTIYTYADPATRGNSVSSPLYKSSFTTTVKSSPTPSWSQSSNNVSLDSSAGTLSRKPPKPKPATSGSSTSGQFGSTGSLYLDGGSSRGYNMYDDTVGARETLSRSMGSLDHTDFLYPNQSASTKRIPSYQKSLPEVCSQDANGIENAKPGVSRAQEVYSEAIQVYPASGGGTQRVQSLHQPPELYVGVAGSRPGVHFENTQPNKDLRDQTGDGRFAGHRSSYPGTANLAINGTKHSTNRGSGDFTDNRLDTGTFTGNGTLLYTTSPLPKSVSGNRSHSLDRSSSFNGPSDFKPRSPRGPSSPPVIHYTAPVSSGNVKDKLESWGNKRQNGRTSLAFNLLCDGRVKSASQVPSHDLMTGSNHELNFGSQRRLSEPRELGNNTDLYGGAKFHYDQGQNLPRTVSGVQNGYGTLDRSTNTLQQKLDELNLGNHSASSPMNTVTSSPSLLTAPGRFPTFDESRSPLAPINSGKQPMRDWEVAPGQPGTNGLDPALHSHFGNITNQHRYHSAPTRKLKSILKKRSAYDTVSGGENWSSYFQEVEFSGYGLQRQNTMPNMRQGAPRAQLPQLGGRKSAGRRVHFAV